MPTTEVAPDSGGLRTRAEAARYLNTSPRRLDELIRAGAIVAVRDGRNVKITQAELERYIADLPSHEPVSA
jgi:excisionase family DNA binding protein